MGNPLLRMLAGWSVLLAVAEGCFLASLYSDTADWTLRFFGRRIGEGWLFDHQVSGFAPTPFDLSCNLALLSWCVMPLWWLARVVRWKLHGPQKEQQMRCRRCGYDLRASEGRCPECGQAFAPADVTVRVDADSPLPSKQGLRTFLLLLALVLVVGVTLAYASGLLV